MHASGNYKFKEIYSTKTAMKHYIVNSNSVKQL